jgi:hypothetical protein
MSQHSDHVHGPDCGCGHSTKTVAVSDSNPAVCAPVPCGCKHAACEHEKVWHGDHWDYLVDGRLHFPHGDHCDDHGPIAKAA